MDGSFDDSWSSESPDVQEEENQNERRSATDENNELEVTNEGEDEYTEEDPKVLETTCPEVVTFFDFYLTTTESLQTAMVGALAPHALLIQCVDMFAGMDLDKKSEIDQEVYEEVHKLGFKGETMVWICIKVFGSAEEEAQEVDDDLSNAQNAADVDKRSKALRSLVTQLEKLLRSMKKK